MKHARSGSLRTIGKTNTMNTTNTKCAQPRNRARKTSKQNVARSARANKRMHRLSRLPPTCLPSCQHNYALSRYCAGRQYSQESARAVPHSMADEHQAPYRDILFLAKVVTEKAIQRRKHLLAGPKCLVLSQDSRHRSILSSIIITGIAVDRPLFLQELVPTRGARGMSTPSLSMIYGVVVKTSRSIRMAFSW